MEHVFTAPDTSSPMDSEEGFWEECRRVVRVANPAFALMGPVTFHAGFTGLGDRFSEWLKGIFAEEVLPHLLDAVRLGGEEKGRELLERDANFLENSPSFLREGSGRAGRLLLRHGSPSGVKCLTKLELAVMAGEIPAHFPTVFGARCGVFSIGEGAAALAYVWQELKLGAPDWREDLAKVRLAEAAGVIEDYFQRNGRTATSISRRRAVFTGQRSNG